MRSRRFTGWRPVLALVVGFVLVASACTSGATPTPAPASAAPASAAPASAAPSTETTAPASPAPSAASASIGDQILALYGVSVPDPTCDVKGKTVHFVTEGKGHPVIRLFMQGFLDGAAELGMVPVLAVPDAFDPTQALALADQAMATGTSGMVITGFEPAWLPLFKKAADKGIPAIDTHTLFAVGAVPGMLGTVGFDNVEEGIATAKVMAKAVGEKGTIAITQTSFNLTEDTFSKSFTKYVTENYPNMKVLKAEETGGLGPDAIAKATSILQAHPDVVGAFDTGGAGVTWREAQKAAGRQIITMATDFTRENLDLVKNGQMYAIIAEPSYPENYLGARVLARAMCGDVNPFSINIPVPIIDKTQLEPFYFFNVQAGE